MKLEEFIELFDLISKGMEQSYSRKQALLERKASLESTSIKTNKVFSDTCRIEQKPNS